jgi:poly-gamma-glutamate capsule biosynthesis protein CapA/YwtB (metallophosphatase superfamily)
MDTLNYLQNINLKVACLAHNHVYDHLEDGFEKTTTLLKKKGIETIGAGSSILKASNPLILSFNSITLGLLNYITKDTNPNLPVEAKIFLNVFSEEKVIEDIKRIKSHVNHVVLLLHWGGRVEGGLYPDYDQPTIARKLIDAGADLIIGHHSHTFHPYEVYRGKSIFYSLGNFCFSDFTFESTSYSMPLRRMVTGIVSVSFNKNNYEVNIDFFKNKIHGFQEIPEYKRRIRSRNLIFRTLLQYYPFWLVYYFSLKNLTPLFLFIKRKDISPGTKLKRMSKSLVRRLS